MTANGNDPLDCGVAVLIPARGGSKGIPGKNIADLGGAPLIAYSIRAALATPSLRRVFVSTDDEAIAETALEWGAEVPFLRPRDLAGDESPLVGVLRHFMDMLTQSEGTAPAKVAVMYPTQPFRSAALLDRLCGLLLAGHGSVTTVKPIRVPPRRFFRRGTGDSILPLAPARTEYIRTHYRPSGYLTGWKWGHDWVRPYVFAIHDPVALHDIDEPADLDLARRIIEQGLFRPDWRLEKGTSRPATTPPSL